MGASPGPSVDVAIGRQDVEVSTFAGGVPGFHDGRAWGARFCGPNAIASDKDGNLYVADSGNHRVRRITLEGEVTTIAGGGDPGGSGDRADGPAMEARFRYPSGVAVGSDGTIFISDTGNQRVCQLRNGNVATLAGSTSDPKAGGPAPVLQIPAALTTLPDGSVWVWDLGRKAVRRIGPDGQVSTPDSVPGVVRASLGEGPGAGSKLAVTASSEGRGSFGSTPFTVGKRSAATTDGPLQIFADAEHSVLLASRPDAPAMLIAGRRIAGNDFTGSQDGEGHRVLFGTPCAVAVVRGQAFIADYGGHCIRVARLPAWLVEGRDPPGDYRSRWRQSRGG